MATQANRLELASEISADPITVSTALEAEGLIPDESLHSSVLTSSEGIDCR